MTAPAAPPVTIRCARCGTPFVCDPDGACWCKDEAFRAPMPANKTESCLCPTCLRAAQKAAPR